MHQEPNKLKLGKRSWFVKRTLKDLRQEDDTWEADFFPLPCSDSPHGTVWMGLVLSHAHDNVLTMRDFREPPTVNDLARLLADAMERPMWGSVHRPRRLFLRANARWAELLPHLQQIGLTVLSQDTLPKWDRNFGDLQAKADRHRAARPAPRSRTAASRRPRDDPRPGGGQSRKRSPH